MAGFTKKIGNQNDNRRHITLETRAVRQFATNANRSSQERERGGRFGRRVRRCEGLLTRRLTYSLVTSQTGLATTLDPWPDSPYTLLVARAKAQRCRVWRAHYLRPLPTIPVPLAKPDDDIPLELQPMIDEIYRLFRYERSIDYSKPLNPAPIRRRSLAGEAVA